MDKTTGEPLAEAMDTYRRAIDAYAVAVLDANPGDTGQLAERGRLALAIFRARRDLRRLGFELPVLFVRRVGP